MFDEPSNCALRDAVCLISRKLTAAQSLTLTLPAGAPRRRAARRWRLDAAGEGHEGGGAYFSAAKSKPLPPRGSPHPANAIMRSLRSCFFLLPGEFCSVLPAMSLDVLHINSAVICNCFFERTNEPDHVPLLESLPMAINQKLSSFEPI